jgi:excisionase family DNA binding protein
MQTGFAREDFMECEKLVDVEQIAEMLGLSVATIRKWISKRFIPHRKIGRAVRFSVFEIQEWHQSQRRLPLTESKTNKGGIV